jgi:hypothetical protein
MLSILTLIGVLGAARLPAGKRPGEQAAREKILASKIGGDRPARWTTAQKAPCPPSHNRENAKVS